MEYEGQICRAPMERGAYKLPVMVGCCYNNCRFCDLFKHLKSRVIPIEEVEADVKRGDKGTVLLSSFGSVRQENYLPE